MNISATCTRCHYQMRASDSSSDLNMTQSGRFAICPRCGAAMQLSSISRSNQSSTAQKITPVSQRPTPPPSSRTDVKPPQPSNTRRSCCGGK